MTELLCEIYYYTLYLKLEKESISTDTLLDKVTKQRLLSQYQIKILTLEHIKQKIINKIKN